MLHARIARFDVMSTVALFDKTFRKINKGYIGLVYYRLCSVSLGLGAWLGWG